MKKKLIYIIFSLIIIGLTTVILLVFINHNRVNLNNTTYKYISGDAIPEGTNLNDLIKINQLYKLSEKDIKIHDFIYKDIIILIDSSPIRRELDKGIMTCWNSIDEELIQVKCPDAQIKKISDTYGINSYESKNVFFNLKYKLNK